ncbi:uncharacterized protein AMSG_00291 [Thecamonas trahens ATCC 50062]|uniref:Uncharacterized protein n=1 Tax=Thecamonas trahens ATCC 50062 TaxID=461836 RepID=A0A0L0D1P5_THETB|nr:hypothetical protein AMSG_00291 [Thecamonas trahens ATCC 50062]KNC46172.1 hypothetical protein AMSG_00291 [Thecamonas trahens ATCC 50062]|eukprot:XP_013763147.1 hypothetical protein AMSG_00291 [Thecamonas trahens ATCC 50062]
MAGVLPVVVDAMVDAIDTSSLLQAYCPYCSVYSSCIEDIAQPLIVQGTSADPHSPFQIDLAGDWLESVLGGDAQFVYNCMCQAEAALADAGINGSAWDLLDEVMQGFFVGADFRLQCLIKDGVPIPLARRERSAFKELTASRLNTQRAASVGPSAKGSPCGSGRISSLKSLTAAAGGFAVEDIALLRPSGTLANAESVLEALEAALNEVLEAAIPAPAPTSANYHYCVDSPPRSGSSHRLPRPDLPLQGMTAPETPTLARHNTPSALDTLLDDAPAAMSMSMSVHSESLSQSLIASSQPVPDTPVSLQRRSSLGAFGLHSQHGRSPSTSPPALSLTDIASTSVVGSAAPKKPHMSRADSQALRETQTFDEPGFCSQFFSPTYSSRSHACPTAGLFSVSPIARGSPTRHPASSFRLSALSAPPMASVSSAASIQAGPRSPSPSPVPDQDIAKRLAF